MFLKSLHDHDAPCAVCYIESRGSHSGWTLEYKGYLMSAHHGHKGRTQFICVDGNAEGTTGLRVVRMVHYCILLKVRVVLFLAHHTEMLKNLPVLFALNDLNDLACSHTLMN